ncbi:ribonuclease R, partial [Candidatus Hydrogenedentota bacterium]
KHLVAATLEELVDKGRIISLKGRRFGFPEMLHMVVGQYSGTRKGFGFVIPDEVGRADVFVPERDVNGAMHGDKVVVRVAGDPKAERISGEIIKILSRAREYVTGKFEDAGHLFFVVPVEERIPWDILIPGDSRGGAKPGEMVVVRLIEYPQRTRGPVGEIFEVLGMKGAPGVDTRVTISKHELRDEFPAEVFEEAEAKARPVSEADRKGRKDFRDVPMVTIDGADAKDFDDAVSIELLANGHYKLGVHIADVSHYVKPGSPLDEEAYLRSTSVYLADRVIPMLPESLSNGMCSLRSGEDRLAQSAIMYFDAKGKLLQKRLYDSVIRVDKRATYDEVYAILSGAPDAPLDEYPPKIVDRLRAMDKLARILRRKRFSRGALELELPEARAVISDDGTVASLELREQNSAHQLIEEFMLAANEAVATHAGRHGIPFVYRIHERPDLTKLESFATCMTELGHPVNLPPTIGPKATQKLLNSCKETSHERLAGMLLLRSLAQARYSPQNVGHFGLASQEYAHFTSPIRRYPDLMVHRILRMLRQHGAPAVRSEKLDLAEKCAWTSQRERAAMEAEREVLKRKQAEYMKQHVGDEFDGYISGVQSWGVYVCLDDTLAEGLIRLSDLSDDYYEHEPRRYSITGEHTGKVFRLGDPIRVQLIRADTEASQLDFTPAPGHPKRKRKGPKPRRKKYPQGKRGGRSKLRR